MSLYGTRDVLLASGIKAYSRHSDDQYFFFFFHQFASVIGSSLPIMQEGGLTDMTSMSHKRLERLCDGKFWM